MNIKDEDIKKIDEQLKKNMTIDGVVNKRYYHSLGVAKMMQKLNEYYQFDFDSNYVYLTGLLHDCAKLIDKEELKNIIINDLNLNDTTEVLKYPSIWHAFCGKVVVEKIYNINDEDIKNAIFYHSTGRPGMSILEQLVFVSDFIEEGRIGSYFDEARSVCFVNLNKGTLCILDRVLSYLKENNYGIYELTYETYKYYLELEKK